MLFFPPSFLLVGGCLSPPSLGLVGGPLGFEMNWDWALGAGDIADSDVDAEEDGPTHVDVDSYIGIPAIDETMLAGFETPQALPSWPTAWLLLVDQIRHAPPPIFWELFVGMVVLTAAFAQ